MKLIITALAILTAFSCVAQEAPQNDWRLGYSPLHVAKETLAKPGWRLVNDTGTALRQILLFASADTAIFFTFKFFNGYSEEAILSYEGTRIEDINFLYSKYNKVGPNDWIDERQVRAHIHREFTDGRTEISITRFHAKP